MLSFDIKPDCECCFEVKGAKGDSKLAKVIDGSITSLEAKDLAGVTAIRDYAFCYWTGEHIEIPSTVKKVGKYAFQYCSNMQSDIELRAVENVGEYAFENSGIKSLVLGANAKTYGNFAFANCSNLKSITLENGATLGNYIFERCTALESIELPPSANDIKLRAFYCCTNLKKVVLPETLTWIDKYAFQNCDLSEGVIFKGNGTRFTINSEAFHATKLREVDFPNGLVRLYNHTFYKCTELKRVYLPSSTAQLDGKNFDGCTALENLTVNRTTPPALLQTLGVIPATAIIYVPYNSVDTYKAATNWSAYADQIQPILDVIIADGVTEITDSQFAGMEIETVYIPASVTSIAANAFSNCTMLKSITVAENNPVYSSQDGILYNKDKNKIILAPLDLTGNVVIPEGITSINLKDRKKLTGLVLPQSLKGIETWGLSGLASLKKLVIPKNVAFIGTYALRSSNFREGLIFETTDLKLIPQQTLTYSNMVELELPEGLERFGDFGSPLGYNNNLKKIVLPSTLKETRSLAYYGRYDIEVISKAIVPPTAIERLFIMSAPSVIRVPKGSLEAYQTATNWSEWADKMVALEE